MLLSLLLFCSLRIGNFCVLSHSSHLMWRGLWLCFVILRFISNEINLRQFFFFLFCVLQIANKKWNGSVQFYRERAQFPVMLKLSIYVSNAKRRLRIETEQKLLYNTNIANITREKRQRFSLPEPEAKAIWRCATRSCEVINLNIYWMWSSSDLFGVYHRVCGVFFLSPRVYASL